jgi:tetratricopeptide (TPR) repeat protein
VPLTEAVFRDLLGRLEASVTYDAASDHAMTLARLGRCQAAQSRAVPAIEWHRRTLGEFERISESDEPAKEMLGRVYTDLGDNLRQVGQFDQAQQAYENDLVISREVNDQRSVGVHLGQLGTLALLRGELAEARQRHTEALVTFRGLGEPQMEAAAWGNLGNVAEQEEKWDKADRCYRKPCVYLSKSAICLI